MLNQILALLFLLILSHNTTYAVDCVGSEENLTQCWKKNLELFGGTGLPENKQAFCYIKEDGTVGGENIDKPLVIASVSKIFTSLWAINRSQFGPQHQFTTQFHINGNNLHIEGGNDPIFTKRSLYAILDQLNREGITSVDNITYDTNFYFTPEAIDNTLFAHVYNEENKHHCSSYIPNEKYTTEDLEYYFNSNHWGKNLQMKSTASIPRGSSKCVNSKLTGMTIAKDYQIKRQQLNFNTENINFSFKSIQQVESNPFPVAGNKINKTKTIIYKSKTLGEIIKFINVNSANQPSDLLFHILGGEKQFQKEFRTMISKYKSYKDFQFISGSGLSNKVLQNGRWTIQSNTASCRTVLSILELFLKYSNKIFDPLFDPRSEKFLTSQETLYENITKMYLAVSGVEGTIEKRYRSSFPQNFVGKTGTLGNGSSLVGTLQTQNGLRHFVMINNYSRDNYLKKANNAKDVQFETIKSMFQILGKKSFQYKYPHSLTKQKFKPFESVQVVN